MVVLTTRDEISNDPLECDPHKGHVRLRSPVGIAPGTSGRAFADMACLYGMDFIEILIGTALTGIFVIGTPFTGVSSGFGNTACQVKDLSGAYTG